MITFLWPNSIVHLNTELWHCTPHKTQPCTFSCSAFEQMWKAKQLNECKSCKMLGNNHSVQSDLIGRRRGCGGVVMWLVQTEGCVCRYRVSHTRKKSKVSQKNRVEGLKGTRTYAMLTTNCSPPRWQDPHIESCKNCSDIQWFLTCTSHKSDHTKDYNIVTRRVSKVVAQHLGETGKPSLRLAV